MGVGPSKNSEQERKEREEREKIYVKNAQQLADSKNELFITSLNIDDLTEKERGEKPILPNLSKGGSNFTHESIRNRYDQFNIFDELQKYEKNMKGGNDPKLVETVSVAEVTPNKVVKAEAEAEVDIRDNQTSDEALEKVRNTILSHLEQLNKNKVGGGGGCGCDGYENAKGGNTSMLVSGPQKKLYRDDSATSSTTSTSSESTSSSQSSSTELGKKSKGKGKKKVSTKFNIEETSSTFIIDSSETGNDRELKSRRRKAVDTSNDDNSSSSSSSELKPRGRKNKKATDNSKSSSSESDSEGGLSIFPFNSSDVNSSVSSKNLKTLRRRV